MSIFVDPNGIGAASSSAAEIQSQVDRWMKQSRPSIDQLVKEGERFAPKPAPAGITPPTQAKPMGTMARIGTGLGLNMAASLLPDGAIKSGIQAGASALMVPGMTPLTATVVGVGGAMERANNNQAIAQGFNGGKVYGQYRQEQEHARDQDRMAIAANNGLQQLIAQGLDPAKAAKIAQVNAKLYGDGNTAATRDQKFRQTPGNMLEAPIQPAAPTPSVNSLPVKELKQPDFLGMPGKGEDLTKPPRNSGDPVTPPTSEPGKSEDPAKPPRKPGDPVTTPTSVSGVTRTQIAGSNVPLYSDKANPTDGFNTTPGLNGNVGNLSVVGIDKAAIERGTAATKDLNAYKEAWMRARADGGSPEDYLPGGARAGGPHGASLGGGTEDALQRALQSPFANVREQALATMSQQQAQAAQQKQFDASQAIAQGNLNLGQRRLAMDEALYAPSIQTQQQIAKLNSDYLALNDQNDPGGAKRQGMAAQILTMQGKTPQPKFTSHVVDPFGAAASGNTVRTGQALMNVDRIGKVSALGADGKPFGSKVLQGEERKAAIADAQRVLQEGKFAPEEIKGRLRMLGIDPKEAGMK